MADRLTQLQTCLDQLVEQFNATVNYINTSSEPSLLDEDPTSVSNIAASAPLPANQTQQGSTLGSNRQTVSPSTQAEAESNFENTINELSTDIILKSRQISMLIDSLPGIGVSPESQLKIIDDLSKELQSVEQEQVKKIQEKDKLLKWCESLIVEVATGISETRH
ncbi:DNA-directed RNA polymerase II holoenzyme and kornberg s mediator [Scheffersomyces stipitis CBS 6054]|uniref:Mediator of RNA polymerase II transcription subunit 21 n=1 Tax=Scheffersomyces stipitis (strain ATCC 58785 / CBS 6054 / NBRC 10063 / NRRL Y-11545) TaxID=322104 RepID=MED21_PICST|nr:DNA-directed RNA polymerase II holoenzyme and kornberg s mediator [Scheffersomyces stipitis CBS 6054]A3LS24.1 RecName: Full=Mediator of RNA polymerase II transcription subunit 21; AltName: Full=Mediator complex subunit 21 [Scheffersomyces stipitis CBS 6054]ABN65489.1 DNA-directed RNA polymerase II holoenzyme and kornberg s mediator [Scheffersomyces stipitis CBS 6054]